jgi:predicted phage gp36 major capsid-like protein
MDPDLVSRVRDLEHDASRAHITDVPNLLGQVREELAALAGAADRGPMTDAQKAAFAALTDLQALLEARIAENEHVRARVAELARDPANVDYPGRADPADNPNTARRTSAMPGHNFQAAALRAIEAHTRGAGAALSAPAADRLEAIVRAEPLPANARYLAAVASPDYASAFGQVLRDPIAASVAMTPHEREAFREALDAQQALNGILALGGPLFDGGEGSAWPLPLQVDPTLILLSDGISGDFRDVATVRTIVGPELTVVTAANAMAGYGAEGSDFGAFHDGDAFPVKIRPQRGHALLKLTYELVADFRGALAEVGRLFADSKAAVEAEAFTVGTGEDEPEGIATGLTPFAGAPSDPTDLRAVQSDVGPRYQGNARWAASLATINDITTFVASADAEEPQILSSDQTRLLRKPIYEANFLAGGRVIYGDIRAGFHIVDRLGLSVEVIPHVMTGGSPTVPLLSGYRGVLAWWRSGSKVANPLALRLLGAPIPTGGSGDE